jgi:hypothetical protein
MKLLLNYRNYMKCQWKLCVGLKVVAAFLGLQQAVPFVNRTVEQRFAITRKRADPPNNQ